MEICYARTVPGRLSTEFGRAVNACCSGAMRAPQLLTQTRSHFVAATVRRSWSHSHSKGVEVQVSPAIAAPTKIPLCERAGTGRSMNTHTESGDGCSTTLQPILIHTSVTCGNILAQAPAIWSWRLAM